MFWQIILHLRSKNVFFLYPPKRNDGILRNEEYILWRRKEFFFKFFQTRSASYNCTQMRCICWRKISSVQRRSLLLSKHWKLKKLKFEMISNLKCSKICIVKPPFVAWPMCVKWPGVLVRHRNIVKLCWSSKYLRRETGENVLRIGVYLSLVSLEKYLLSA